MTGNPGHLLSLLLAVLFVFLFAISPRDCKAEEPAQKFLNALRENGHYELALLYLNQCENNNLAPESFRRRIPLFRAETIIESVNELRDVALWESRLNEAQTLLEGFASSATNADDRSFASETLANLRFKQARFYLNQGESPRLSDTERSQATMRAREMLTNSLSAFETAKQITHDRLEELLKTDSRDTADRATVDQLKNTYTQILLRMPIATEYLADTFAEGSTERTQYLTKAETDYMVVWEKYFRYAAGVDACLFAARCRQKLGKHAEAITLLEELLTMNDQPALVPIKRRAGIMALESYRKTDPYPYEMVIQRLQPLLANLTRSQTREPEWLTIQLEVARALRTKADKLAADGGHITEVNNLQRTAGALAKVVARAPGADQAAALELIAKWNIDLAVDDSADAANLEPQTFADAKSTAAKLIGDLDLQRSRLADLRNQLKTANKNDRTNIEQEIVAQAASLKVLGIRTLETLRLATSLATVETSRADMNHTRYLQAFCYYAMGRHYESALIGEFLMDRYPTVEWTRQATGLVINSYASMYDEAKPEDRTFEQEKLAKACKTVVERWQGSPEASHAAGILARLALSNDNIDTAAAMAENMGGNSAARASISLELAQRIWNEVQQIRNGMTAEELQKNRTEYESKLADAQKLLMDSLAATPEGMINFDSARGSLLLSRVLIELGKPGEAVDQLERQGTGPLDLIKQNHPAVTGSPQAEVLQRETFRTAIGAYLACLRLGGDPAQWIDKAKGVLVALKTQLASLPAADSARELAGIYGTIARELKSQISSMEQEAERMNLARNLGEFLKSLGNTTEDGRTILWAASTVNDVASSLEETNANSDDVKKLYRTSIELLQLARQTEFKGDPQAEELLLETGRYLGLAYRGAEQWTESTQAFAEVLEKRATLLRTQLDVAESLQIQGRKLKQAKPYALAMMGGEPRADAKTNRKSNVIWGWRQLVMVTKGRDEFADVYARSLFGLIESRLEWGVIEKSDKAIQSALQELANWRKADPELGGPLWKPRVEALELRIKLQLGSD